MNEEGLSPANIMAQSSDWWATLWPDPEGVLRRLGIDFGQSVLDLCCGDGHFTVPIYNIVGRTGRVMALDMNSSMVNRAKTRTRNAGIDPDTIDWIEGDGCKLTGRLPMLPDLVLVANTFHGVEDKNAMAKEVYSSLMPGGQFVVINWHHRPKSETTVFNQPRGPETAARMLPDQVIDIATEAGFRLHGVIDLPPYHYGAVFDKTKT